MKFICIVLRCFVVKFFKISIICIGKKVAFTIILFIIDECIGSINSVWFLWVSNSDWLSLQTIILLKHISVKFVVIGFSKKDKLISFFKANEVDQLSLLLSVNYFRFENYRHFLFQLSFQFLLFMLLNFIYNSHLKIT